MGVDGNETKRRWGCLSFLVLLLTLLLGFCGYVKWREPRTLLPEDIQWSEVLAFGASYGLREGCIFAAYRLSPETKEKFDRGTGFYGDWHPTPLILQDGQYADLGPVWGRITLYAESATTCASQSAVRQGLVTAYERARSRPGSRFKIINHGEAIIVVAPREGVVWFLNFG